MRTFLRESKLVLFVGAVCAELAGLVCLAFWPLFGVLTMLCGGLAFGLAFLIDRRVPDETEKNELLNPAVPQVDRWPQIRKGRLAAVATMLLLIGVILFTGYLTGDYMTFGCIAAFLFLGSIGFVAFHNRTANATSIDVEEPYV